MEWEWWRIAAAVVLVWLLLGATSTIIPQCSRRMQQQIIAFSRIGRDRAIERFARWRGYSERHASYFVLPDTDSAHLGWAYVVFVLSGLWSFFILWKMSRIKKPSDPAG